MDLDRCPRCGAAWTGGDVCTKCRFVPIGAGLDKLPKKKKRRNRRYREPGSSRGLLMVVLLGLLGFGAYRYQPWTDDWDMVRSWFGQGRHHSVVGEWEIVKAVAVNKDEALIARDTVEKGELQFNAKGVVRLDLIHPETETTADGKYLVEGERVAMREIHSTGDTNDPIPASMNMTLAWTGEDTVVASNKAEAIYLHRRKGKSALQRFMQMDLKSDKAEAPGQMRGVIGTMKRAADEANQG